MRSERMKKPEKPLPPRPGWFGDESVAPRQPAAVADPGYVDVARKKKKSAASGDW